MDKRKSVLFEFGAGLFHINIDESRHAFNTLQELISDEEYLRAYYTKKTKEFEEQNSEKNIPDELKVSTQKLFFVNKAVGINDAVAIFNKQTLVVVSTIIESILDEFFLCVFCKSPEKMYEYIQVDEEGKVKGKVDIKEVINSDSREDLLLSLARQAASRAMQGEFKSTVKRLKLVTVGEEFSKELTDKLIALNQDRNKIVHELDSITVSFDDVRKHFETAFETVEYLEKLALQMQIPVWRIDE